MILPRDFARQPDRRYPVRVHIGGYGGRYTDVDDMMADGSRFRRTWMADDTPPMILIHLDGAGPLGDPYQVDSANHGPYGAAVTGELIPHIEGLFRGIGKGEARVLDGGSTGGWVALALQVFYPDFFNGAWSFCPDSVDFRSFQLVNIYEDENAYINGHGFERPVGARRLGRGPVHDAARVPAGERDGPGRLVHVLRRPVGRLERDLRRPRAPTAARSRSGTPRPAGSTTRPPSTGRPTTSAASSRSAGPSSAPSSRGSCTSGSARPTTTSSTTPCTASTRSSPAPSRPTKARSPTDPGRVTAGWGSPSAT